MRTVLCLALALVGLALLAPAADAGGHRHVAPLVQRVEVQRVEVQRVVQPVYVQRVVAPVVVERVVQPVYVAPVRLRLEQVDPCYPQPAALIEPQRFRLEFRRGY